jgi:hypothetical protein
MPVPYDINCPYCGEDIELLLDESMPDQCYIEDCSVCCRPIVIAVNFDDDGVPHVHAAREDDA